MKPPSRKWFLERTINNNLKILEKYVWTSSFLVNLKACRFIASNFTDRWTLSWVFFNSILSPHMLFPCIDSSPPPSNFGDPTPSPCFQNLSETLSCCKKSLWSYQTCRKFQICYSSCLMLLRCCFLILFWQSWLLKLVLITLLWITQVAHHLLSL